MQNFQVYYKLLCESFLTGSDSEPEAKKQKNSNSLSPTQLETMGQFLSATRVGQVLQRHFAHTGWPRISAPQRNTRQTILLYCTLAGFLYTLIPVKLVATSGPPCTLQDFHLIKNLQLFKHALLAGHHATNLLAKANAALLLSKQRAAVAAAAAAAVAAGGGSGNNNNTAATTTATTTTTTVTYLIMEF